MIRKLSALVILALNFTVISFFNSSSAMQLSSASDSTELYTRLHNEGVIFYAFGNEPFWNFKLSEGDLIYFEMLDGTKMNAISRMSRAMDANVRRYDAATETGSITVSVYEEECTDNMSGDKFGYKVVVQYRGSLSGETREVTGCGRFVPDLRLNGKWGLAKIGQSPVADSAYRGRLPFLEFDMKSLRVSGVAGCNTVFGPLRQEDSYLKFGNLAMTMMGCPDEMRENEIVKGLTSATQYEISGNELIISNPDAVLLVYRKDMSKEEPAEFDPVRLNDLWTLYSIEGVEANASDYMKGLPFLELHVKDMKYYGKTGCNNMFGNFEAEGETIKFGPAGMTKMMCPGDNEQKFIKALNAANRWKVENMKLYLYEGDRELIVFRKVD